MARERSQMLLPYPPIYLPENSCSGKYVVKTDIYHYPAMFLRTY